MLAPINGVRAVRVNGNPLRLAGPVSYAPGGPARTAKIGPVGVAGFAESHEIGFVEVATTDGPDVELAELQSISDATVTVELRNGKAFVLNGASLVGRLEGSTEEGEFTLRFEGTSSQEIRL